MDVAYLIAGFVLLYGGLWFAADRTSVLCQLPRPTPGAILLRAFFVPDMIWTYSIGWVDLVQHTHPRSAWFKDRSEWGFYKANVQSTTHVLVPFQMDFSMHHILRHTAHHIDPRIPLYALEPAQRQIEQAHGKEIIVANLSRGYVLGLLKICRLYDYDQHCWLDYDGSPTSVPARHYHEVDRSISQTCLQE